MEPFQDRNGILLSPLLYYTIYIYIRVHVILYYILQRLLLYTQTETKWNSSSLTSDAELKHYIVHNAQVIYVFEKHSVNIWYCTHRNGSMAATHSCLTPTSHGRKGNLLFCKLCVAGSVLSTPHSCARIWYNQYVKLIELLKKSYRTMHE